MIAGTTMRRSNPLLLLIVTLVGGIVLGALAFGVSRVFWLLVVMPLALGGLGGAGLAWAIRRGHVRSVALAAICALVMGLLTFGVYKGGEYWYDMRDFRQALISQLETLGAPTMTDAELDALTDEIFMDEFGATGLLGYLKLKAEEGTSIGRPGQSGGGIPISGPFYWVIELLDLVIITGTMLFLAIPAARQPFCAMCGAWYPSAGRSVGRAPEAAAPPMIDALKAGNIRGVVAPIQPNPNLVPAVTVDLHPCPTDPNHDVLVRITKVALNAKGNVERKVLIGQKLPASQMPELSSRAHDPSQVVVH